MSATEINKPVCTDERDIQMVDSKTDGQMEIDIKTRQGGMDEDMHSSTHAACSCGKRGWAHELKHITRRVCQGGAQCS